MSRDELSQWIVGQKVADVGLLLLDWSGCYPVVDEKGVVGDVYVPQFGGYSGIFKGHVLDEEGKHRLLLDTKGSEKVEYDAVLRLYKYKQVVPSPSSPAPPSPSSSEGADHVD